MLITLKINQFKNLFQVTLKKNQDGKSYYLIEPKVINQDATKYLINDIEYVVNDYHISINANTVPSGESTETSYHLTINLKVSKGAGSAILHVHFDKNNQIVFSTLRNSNQNLIPIDAKTNIMQMVKGLTENFCQSLWDLYINANIEYRKNHEELLGQLTFLSKSLSADGDLNMQLEKYQKYKQQLQLLIVQLNEWFRINLQPENHVLSYFNALKVRIDNMLSEISAKIALIADRQSHTSVDRDDQAINKNYSDEGKDKVGKNKESIDKQKLLAIDTKLSQLKSDSTILPWNKIVCEHQLLLDKFNLVQGDDIVLDCMLRSKDLEKLARAQLQQFMTSRNDIKKLTEQDCDQLVKLIPALDFNDLLSAVEYNNPLIVTSILKNHTYININLLIPEKRISLLEFVFEKRNTPIFIALLKAGAYCDRYSQSGNTLLAKACEQGRVDEMVALLNAGASTFKADLQGFNAFGHLTMVEKRKPDFAIIEIFLKNCYSFDINWYQGPRRLGQTPLSFACQLNSSDLVRFLLEHGADPRIARESDFQTPLAVCAYKGFTKSLQMILQYSKFPLEKGHLVQALKAAKQYGKEEIINMINEFSQKNNIDVNDDEEIFTIGAGSDMNTVFNAMGLSSTLNILSLLNSQKTHVPVVMKLGSGNANDKDRNDDKKLNVAESVTPKSDKKSNEKSDKSEQIGQNNSSAGANRRKK